jgi:hypothetical protein
MVSQRINLFCVPVIYPSFIFALLKEKLCKNPFSDKTHNKNKIRWCQILKVSKERRRRGGGGELTDDDDEDEGNVFSTTTAKNVL